MKQVIVVLFLLAVLTSCSQSAVVQKESAVVQSQNEIQKQNEGGTMKITSPAFKEGGMLPAEYTCDGDDISPELNIADVPAKANSLVLICEDPDAPAGTWDHWVVFNIPASATKISKGAEPQGTAGKNSWGRTGYGGPCPPSGTHRYFFKLYALDKRLDIREGSKKADILSAMKGHVVAEAQLMGKFKRA